MMDRNMNLVAAAMLAGIALTGVAAETKENAMPPKEALSEVAETAGRPGGAPDYADVCFRYMRIRKSGKFPTVEDAKKAMSAFHATRVDWYYSGSPPGSHGATDVTPESKAFIDWCHANGMKVGGAINSNTTNAEWKLRNANFGRYIGDPRNPGFVAAAVAWGKAQIDAGVDTLVCDDFFGYRSRDEMQLFNDNVIKAIKAHKAGFTIAGNNGGFIGTDYVKPYAFDFHYSDSNFAPPPGAWWAASKAHRALKSAFLIHPNVEMPKEVRRKLIALGYATGAHVITPWDEYIHNSKERLFAAPADFADLYGFARALGQQGYLNGYEDAAVGGYELKETRYGTNQPISVSGGSGSLSVFGRAKPGQGDAPVVFHLVEWGEPKASTLRLRIPAVFGTSKVTCKLLAPPKYAEAEHNAAETARDYKALAVVSELRVKVEGEVLLVELPAVTPWAALVIAPAKEDRLRSPRRKKDA